MKGLANRKCRQMFESSVDRKVLRLKQACLALPHVEWGSQPDNSVMCGLGKNTSIFHP